MYRSGRGMIAVLLCLLALVSTWRNQAQDGDGILIVGAWARPTALSRPEGTDTQEPEDQPASGEVSAAYMTIENQDNRVYRLIGASAAVADIVEIHETSMADDVMRMRPVTDGIEIEAGGSVNLEPDGYHVMLMALKRDLVPGGAFMLTLRFDIPEDGSESGTTHTVVVGVPILEQAPEPSDIVVDDAWARPTITEAMAGPEPESTQEADDQGQVTIPGGDVSVAYMTLINRGHDDHRLIEARTGTAEITEIHEVSVQDDVMRMRPVDGIDLPAGSSVRMEPGGYHIMMLGLRGPLAPGEAIVITLKFGSGETMDVAVPVYDAQAVPIQGEGNE